MKKLISFVFIFMLGLLAACGSITNPSSIISCTSFTLMADAVTYPGTSYVRVVDGDGTTLFYQTYIRTGNVSGYNETFVFTTAPDANPITASVGSVDDFGNGPAETLGYTATGSCVGKPQGNAVPTEPPFGFTDGRLNHRDVAAPFAIYPMENGVQFYWINTDRTGSLVLSITTDDLAAVPEVPNENTLIAANESLGLFVYRLTDGSIQAQALTAEGKLYVFILPNLQ